MSSNGRVITVGRQPKPALTMRAAPIVNATLLECATSLVLESETTDEHSVNVRMGAIAYLDACFKHALFEPTEPQDC